MSPFTKKRGVLGTPLREPLSRSSATLCFVDAVAQLRVEARGVRDADRLGVGA